MKKENTEHFSKRLVWRIVNFSMLIVAITILLDVILVWFQKGAISEETVNAIVIYGGIASGVSVAAYSALAGWRDHSLNKHGIHVDGEDKHYIEKEKGELENDQTGLNQEVIEPEILDGGCCVANVSSDGV